MLRPEHTIFRAPFAVELQLEDTPSPDNFQKWQPGFPDTVRTFEVFTASGDKDEPGLVTGDGGFEDVPDAERILGGINMKGPQYAAIARHGSLVMWGFHSTPERLTDTGRRLYLNTLAYAVAHKGALVETLRLRPVRDDLDRALGIFLGLYPPERRLGMVRRHIGGEAVPPELVTDEALRARWLAERRPFLHPIDDGSNWETAYQLAVDVQARELGVANDAPAFLDAIAARLLADADDALAAALLARYVPGVAPAALRGWLREHRDALYFTEAGGWQWRVRGERATSPRLRRVGDERDGLVRLDADVSATTLTITMRIAEGWHAWSPKAVGQEPVAVAILPDSAFEVAGDLDWSDDGHGMLDGYCQIKVPIRRVAAGDRLHVAVTYTICDASTCKPPRTVELER
ncbi:MAG: hypothetical protein H6835_09775 [Planctomycetes bacterium]|nr:hypothetical protein [Planctomycetota bacterium]